jgi:hypothetical protein
MKVHWHLPDHTLSETEVPDIEQLMFLLRLVQGVTLQGKPYRIEKSELVVEEDRVIVSVTLKYRVT